MWYRQYLKLLVLISSLSQALHKPTGESAEWVSWRSLSHLWVWMAVSSLPLPHSWRCESGSVQGSFPGNPCPSVWSRKWFKGTREFAGRPVGRWGAGTAGLSPGHRLGLEVTMRCHWWAPTVDRLLRGSVFPSPLANKLQLQTQDQSQVFTDEVWKFRRGGFTFLTFYISTLYMSFQYLKHISHISYNFFVLSTLREIWGNLESKSKPGLSVATEDKTVHSCSFF